MNTRDLIIKNTKKIVTKESFEKLSMRHLATECGIALSVIYHYFPSKDELLADLYNEINNNFKERIDQVLIGKTVKIKIRQYLDFCFDNTPDIIFCHKYFITYRSEHRKNQIEFIPKALVQKMRDIIKEGRSSKQISSRDESADAGLVAALILGAILENYPSSPPTRIRETLVQRIITHLETALLK